MSANKARGTRAESAVVAYLRERGAIHAERRALRGKHDRGDVAGVPSVTFEIKDHARLALAEWLDEVERERFAGPVPEVGVVVAKRRGKGSPADWYAVMAFGEFVTLLQEAGYVPRTPPTD